MAVTMPARRSSLFGGHGTGAAWDWSSLDDVGGNTMTTLGGEDDEREDEDDGEDEEIEENITVAAGPATSLPRAPMSGKIVKRDITELDDSDNEEDEDDDDIMHDEIIVAPSPHALGKRTWDDTPSSFPNKKVKVEARASNAKKAAPSYLHGIFATQTPRKASPVAQLRSPTTGIAAKQNSRFTNISPPSRRSIPAARPAVRKPSTPFIEIEDSDEDDEIMEVPAVVVKSESLASGSHSESRALDPLKAAQKENQRLTSLRLRQEATERKMREISHDDDVKTNSYEYDMQDPTDHVDPVVELDSSKTHNKKAPEVDLKAKPTTDLSTSLDGSFLNTINPIPALTNMFRKPAKSDGVLKLRRPPPITSNSDDPALSRPPQSTPKTTHIPSLLLNSDQEEQRRIRAAKAKKREESVAAQIRAQADEARKNELAVRQTREAREAEEKAEVDAQIARGARNKEDEAKKREDEAKKREDEWKKGMERKRQEEADKRQKIMDDLKAQKVAEERREKARKDAEARKREEKLKKKQAEARSVFSSLPAPGGLALPPAPPKVQEKIDEPLRANDGSIQQKQKPDEPARSIIPEVKGRSEPTQAAAGPSGTNEHNGEPVHSATNIDDKALREERVRLMKERNARNKITAAEEELPSPEPPKTVVAPLPALTSTLPTPISSLATGTLPDGPISLNSAAGTAAVAKSNRVPNVHNSSFSFDDEYHKRRFGNKLNSITAPDVNLFVWCEEKVPGVEMCRMYLELTGLERNSNTLQKRARQIKEALLELGPERGLLNRAGRGEHEALDQLNALVDARRTAPISQKVPDTAISSTPVTPSDIKLMRLKDQRTEWAMIIEQCEDMGTPWRSETSLRRRYKQVKDLVEATNLDEATLDLIEAGDIDALEQLNSAVPGTGPQSAKMAYTPFRQSIGKHKVDPTLGEIVPHDIQLMQWRDTGTTFSVITERLQELTGVHREHHVAQYRYKKVKPAIERAREQGAVDDDLLDCVRRGEQAAIERLNIAVHGVWPVPAMKSSGRRPKVSHDATNRRDSFISGGSKVIDNNSSFSSETFDEDFWTNTNDLSPDLPVAHDTTGRATQGGKTISPAFYKMCFDAWAEANAEESDPEAEDENQDEPAVTEEDKCHFVHQVQRRELSQEEVFGEEPVDIESKPWLDVGTPLINPLKANIKAGKQSLVSHDPATSLAISRTATQERDLDEDDLVWAKTTTRDAGVVEVRVDRRMRSHGEGILPKASAFMIPRRLFYLMKRVTTLEAQAGDDLFEESPPPIERTTEALISKTAYSTLDRANSKAIDHFTKEVQFPLGEMLNMSERDSYVSAARGNFLSELQELQDKGETALFDRSVEAEDESMEVRVWVEEGKLEGPRNF